MRLHRGKVLYGEMEGSRTEPWRTSSFRRQARGREEKGMVGREKTDREKNQEKQIHFKFLLQCLPEPLAHGWKELSPGTFCCLGPVAATLPLFWWASHNCGKKSLCGEGSLSSTTSIRVVPEYCYYCMQQLLESRAAYLLPGQNNQILSSRSL